MKNNNEKTTRTRRFAKKQVLLVCCALLLCAAAAVTLAYAHSTASMKNVFTVKPVTVDADIEETFEENVKKSVTVKNTDGNVPVFVRAALVVNWANDKGEISSKSVAPTDYTFTLNTTDWQKAGDYYYCKNAVAAAGTTSNLFTATGGLKLTAAGEANVPDGFFLNVEVVAQAIQANPVTAVKAAWGLDAQDGVLVFD